MQIRIIVRMVVGQVFNEPIRDSTASISSMMKFCKGELTSGTVDLYQRISSNLRLISCG